MVEFTAAVVKKAEYTFVVIIVKPDVLDNNRLYSEAITLFSRYFPLMPVVLMAQNFKGDGIFRGPETLVKLVRNERPEDLPWNTYKVRTK
ncbi:MAG TPA: hypothetical protein DD791_12555 [Syntrophomonas sp.]|nr:hypothetical protein [Syntrophomonas sp.]